MSLQTDELVEGIPEENTEKTEDSIRTNGLTFDEFLSKLDFIPSLEISKTKPLGFTDQALKKIDEIENIKKEVKERENTKAKRIKAAVVIQS